MLKIKRKEMVLCGSRVLLLLAVLALGIGSAQAAGQAAGHEGAKWPGGAALKVRLDLGKRVFAKQCQACHIPGGDLDIRKFTSHVGTVGMEAYITGQGRIFTHMPLFKGSERERRAVAEHIVLTLNGGKADDDQRVEVKPLTHTVPPFDRATAKYVLLVWNTLGMKCITDADAQFSFLPPGNAFNAVLIHRGPKPVLVTQGVELAYEAPPGLRNPAAHMDFWKFAPSIIGKELPLNTSAAGKGLTGQLVYNEKSKLYEVAGVPLTPFEDDGSLNPYPLISVTAKDKTTGEVLAATSFVAPVDSEVGCRNCHGGPWRKNGVMGISAETAKNILAAHDKRSGTKLLAQSEAGKPVLCQSCHPDPLLNAPGDPKRLNLPAAIHGFHASYLTGRGEEACSRCHPDNPKGLSRCLRDNHQAYKIGCKRCHGLLEDHTLSLLKGEKNEGKERVALFMKYLKPRVAKSVEGIKARKPWMQEPDCAGCHQKGKKPSRSASSAFNQWVEGPAKLYRSQKDNMGSMPCIACHGAPHATYRAFSDYGRDRDNVQPMQYMGYAAAMGARGDCIVCHTQGMAVDAHHPTPVMRTVYKPTAKK